MGDLECRRCKHPLSDVVQYGNRGPFIQCGTCGLQVRISRVPRPVQPRQRARMSKKARRRERRKLAEGLRTIPGSYPVAAEDVAE